MILHYIIMKIVLKKKEQKIKRSPTIAGLLAQGRGIWGSRRMSVEKIVIALGVGYGDIARWVRDAKKDKLNHTDAELKKELGNIIFSTIRWCDDLGYDPEECIKIALSYNHARY